MDAPLSSTANVTLSSLDASAFSSLIDALTTTLHLVMTPLDATLMPNETIPTALVIALSTSALDASARMANNDRISMIVLILTPTLILLPLLLALSATQLPMVELAPLQLLHARITRVLTASSILTSPEDARSRPTSRSTLTMFK
jgi:hypothetical protein